ncbi:MAG: class I SAM-dependent methyltransferase [Chloroflexi bacterium]|nr:class I SAM-dependent methyltransferase [Chloroflexota bacterium]
MHNVEIIREFSHQAAAFNVAPVMRSTETLSTLIGCATSWNIRGRWVEVACGPGLVARALAPFVDSVLGCDLTPAMAELGMREAVAAGLRNVRLILADALSLPFPSVSVHGTITRFSLHHIPAPLRCVREMVRITVPGGLVVVGDHVTSPDGRVAAWHQEIERLRDPSHWACLSADQIRHLGEQCGLRLLESHEIPFSLSYEEWVTRGSGGPQNRALLEALLQDRPQDNEVFDVVSTSAGHRELHTQYFIGIWQKN